MACDDPNEINCDTKVLAYKKQDTDMYATDEWKTIHSIRVYNKDDGDFTLIDKHITLRLKTGATNGVGSKIFENLILPDIQVFCLKSVSNFFNVLLIVLEENYCIEFLNGFANIFNANFRFTLRTITHLGRASIVNPTQIHT